MGFALSHFDLMIDTKCFEYFSCDCYGFEVVSRVSLAVGDPYSLTTSLCHYLPQLIFSWSS